MHAYRDAIRDRDDRRVVQYAAILNPGPTESCAQGIEALEAAPGSEEALLNHATSIFRTALAG